MGIHDRDYYRDKTRGSGWLTGTAPAVKTILALNVGLFLFGKFLPDDALLEHWFAATSTDIFAHKQLWRLVTATFLHDPFNLWHIASNMLFLWMVGREMEAFYGTREFWWLYLSAGALSTLCWALVDYYGPRQGIMIGASGAVMTVVALYTFYYPHREVIFFIFPVQMWLLLTIYVANDFLQLVGRSGQPVAFASHLGGFAYGVAFKAFDLRLKHLAAVFKFKRPGPRLRVVSADPPPREFPAPRAPAPMAGPSWSPNTATTARPTPTAVVPEELLDAKLDEILGKIAREGPANLTDDEKRILDEASRRARNRRSGRV